MGLRSAAHICQRVTNIVPFLALESGYQILNYLDDFAGDEVPDKANMAFEKLESILQDCGFEESREKSIPPSTEMVFLGVLFNTELRWKIPIGGWWR